MLGLNVDIDQQNSDISKLQSSYRRTSKFAAKLHGRFFVSGSFNKRDQITKEKIIKLPKLIKYNCQPVLEKNQREELRKEALKLIELEEKLAEASCTSCPHTLCQSLEY
jgi:hypothetical protein